MENSTNKGTGLHTDVATAIGPSHAEVIATRGRSSMDIRMLESLDGVGRQPLKDRSRSVCTGATYQ